MAVVVQKIVPSESAGVLFTCHPTTANPAEMVVTSNFGIGEVPLIFLYIYKKLIKVDFN